jgi:hypothetical protein
MTIMRKFLIAGTGLAALAAAAPSAAQYGYGYSQGYNNYGYSQPYGYAQPYSYGANTTMATQQCTAAVQNRLYNRSGIGGILGAVLGAGTTGRVVAVTQVQPTSRGTVRVRGLASSGRVAYNNYGPYGSGAYGALGYGYAQGADLSFRCDVDYRGYVRNVDINRR